jgi:uncharacterized protein YlxP (DUF503 family)
MIVGIAKLHLYLNSQPDNLKAKRRILNHIKDKLRNKFPVSVAEVDNQGYWQKAVLGLAWAASDYKLAESLMQKISYWLEQETEIEVTQREVEFLKY